MANYNVSDTAGTVLGIAGQGIGLGLLAGTARGVMDTMYGDKWRPPRKQRRRPTRNKYIRPYTVHPYRPRYPNFKPRW